MWLPMVEPCSSDVPVTDRFDRWCEPAVRGLSSTPAVTDGLPDSLAGVLLDWVKCLETTDEVIPVVAG